MAYIAQRHGIKKRAAASILRNMLRAESIERRGDFETGNREIRRRSALNG